MKIQNEIIALVRKHHETGREAAGRLTSNKIAEHVSGRDTEIRAVAKELALGKTTGVRLDVGARNATEYYWDPVGAEPASEEAA